jgi:hypothetical protein
MVMESTRSARSTTATRIPKASMRRKASAGTSVPGPRLSPWRKRPMGQTHALGTHLAASHGSTGPTVSGTDRGRSRVNHFRSLVLALKTAPGNCSDPRPNGPVPCQPTTPSWVVHGRMTTFRRDLQIATGDPSANGLLASIDCLA